MSAAGPLSGVRVIDVTTVFMGPSATQMLGDLGADVIKVEAPGGDSTRRIGPCGDQGMGPLYLGLNRNKRSIVLDLKQADGRAALLELVKDADVLAYNVRPAAMQRLGLGYEELAALNPRLIYVGMFGFSQRGRYAPDPAFDDLIQAACALPVAMAAGSGDIPRYMPLTIADRSVGLYAFGVIAAALYAQARSGKGQRIDVPMFETMVPYVMGDHLYGETYVPAKGGFGYPRLMSPERRPYRTRDGHICLLLYSDEQWRVFWDRFGRPDVLTRDPRFRDIGTRSRHVNELYAEVAAVLVDYTIDEIRSRLSGSDFTLFPVLDIDGLAADPHLRATGFVHEIEHPTEGRLVQTGVPSEWSDTPPSLRRPAPRLGEHTREVLREAGMVDATIDALIETGAATQSAT